MKIAIVSHIETAPARLPLPADLGLANRSRSLYQWTRLEYEGALWDELALLSHLRHPAQRPLSIWDMPLYSGLHLESAVRREIPGATVRLVNVVDAERADETLASVRSFEPDAVVLSTTFQRSLGGLAESARLLRRYLPDTPLVAGGHFVHKEVRRLGGPEPILRHLGPNTRLVVSAHGEAELCGLLKDPNRPTGANPIDGDCPYEIDRWSVDYDRASLVEPVAPVRTSCGCAFRCAFCSYPDSGGGLTTKRIDTVLDELCALHRRGVRQIVFLDDAVNIPNARFRELLDGMIERGLTEFRCYAFCRCASLDAVTVALMKRCGFEAVLLGIESGSDEILRQMDKRADVSSYRRGIDLLAAAGILSFAAIIVGFPGETDATLKETAMFLETSGVDYCYLQPFYYLHNSPIHERRAEFDLQGIGLMWKHRTMDSSACASALRDLYRRLKHPIPAHGDNALWELAYLQSKGFDRAAFRRYREVTRLARLRAMDALDPLTPDLIRALADAR